MCVWCVCVCNTPHIDELCDESEKRLYVYVDDESEDDMSVCEGVGVSTSPPLYDEWDTRRNDVG